MLGGRVRWRGGEWLSLGRWSGCVSLRPSLLCWAAEVPLALRVWRRLSAAMAVAPRMTCRGGPRGHGARKPARYRVKPVRTWRSPNSAPTAAERTGNVPFGIVSIRITPLLSCSVNLDAWLNLRGATRNWRAVTSRRQPPRRRAGVMPPYRRVGLSGYGWDSRRASGGRYG